METAFSYPSPNWIVAVFVVSAVIGGFLIRNVLAALFIGVIATIGAWYAHETYLPVHIENWLAGQRAYAILFRDFPKEKPKFILEYEQAFKTDGELGVARKHEEMKIIMLEHFVKHYIAHAPAEVIHNYIIGEAWLLSTLSNKNKPLCLSYLANTKNFEDVWRTVGSDIFTMSLRYVPSIITEAEDHPQPVTPKDQAEAVQLFDKLLTAMQKSGELDGRTLSCDTVYREYYLLSQMPPHDSALILKLILSEDHLQTSTQRTFLQQLLPFQ